MNDARHYRLNAAECMLAATTCQGDYSSLLVFYCRFWQPLARHGEAMEKPLVSWETADPASPARLTLRRPAPALCP
jgi:hypothetical protein